MKYTIEFLKQAHQKSIFNKSKILSSNNCACFCCEEFFSTSEIKDYFEEVEGKDETAVCPKCGIDSIIDDSFPINDPIFLVEMSKYFFSYCIYLMFINIFYQIDLLSQQPLFHHHFH